MSDVRNHPPTELLEMFERRQRDVGPAAPMAPSIRRRIRTRRSVTAAAVVALGVLAIGVAVRTLPGAFDRQPADEPKPPAVQFLPTASGRTELFRWRVLAGPVSNGIVQTQLQTSSLSGGGWYTVKERTFDLSGDSFWDTYQLTGPTPQQSMSSVLWGFVPAKAERIVVDSGDGCEPVTVSGGNGPGAAGDGAISIWGANARCAGPGTVSALRADGSELLPPRPYILSPTDLWATAWAKAGGVGWIVHRILPEDTGVSAGDAGIPNDLRLPVTADELDRAAVAWREVPEGDGAPFIYGLAANEVDRVVIVYADGFTERADVTLLPGDDFKVFWVQPGQGAPAQLVAFDASCNLIANQSLNDDPAGDPPSGACTPNG